MSKFNDLNSKSSDLTSTCSDDLSTIFSNFNTFSDVSSLSDLKFIVTKPNTNTSKQQNINELNKSVIFQETKQSDKNNNNIKETSENVSDKSSSGNSGGSSGGSSGNSGSSSGGSSSGSSGNSGSSSGGSSSGKDTSSHMGSTYKNMKMNNQSTVYHIDKDVTHKVYIDVAVVSEEYTKIELMCEDHVINLDEIDVTLEIFQIMFYPYKENFGINRDLFLNNKNFIPFISFLRNFRSINGKPFNLLEEIIANLETDLCVSRNCFTKESLVELTNEISNIKTFLDIKCHSVLASLTWSNILDIINNYKVVKGEIVPVLIINITFKSDTSQAKDTIIRFQYKICSNS